MSSLLSFLKWCDKKYVLTTSNQNEIEISIRISWKEIAGLQNTKDVKIIRLSDHGMTFCFRLFQKSSLAANVSNLYLSLWKNCHIFPISSCFSFYSQFKSQSTTWIHNFHNFPNICCAHISYFFVFQFLFAIQVTKHDLDS